MTGLVPRRRYIRAGHRSASVAPAVLHRSHPATASPAVTDFNTSSSRTSAVSSTPTPDSTPPGYRASWFWPSHRRHRTSRACACLPTTALLRASDSRFWSGTASRNVESPSLAAARLIAFFLAHALVPSLPFDSRVASDSRKGAHSHTAHRRRISGQERTDADFAAQ
ncbi:hypothetical protein B0H13DRAFT_2331707 [Mycena leptocephala]|nr:hypothetical protein B0H13DRAFT_2331707 [Mycena leptocephala]